MGKIDIKPTSKKWVSSFRLKLVKMPKETKKAGIVGKYGNDMMLVFKNQIKKMEVSMYFCDL